MKVLTATELTAERTIANFRAFLATPAGAIYLRRRFVPAEYVRLVAWLRARAPFNHSR